ncbi:mitogen-activated protein kinase kinase kinase 3 [Elysia marginata]|uniref:Mitogen-activated protein kinase kinase kinase 3 n=1 Tax=Elysia marginata TaxID=1093978 RepID=A0AAV4FTQ5_9GAST|nr:mitogen-activated protein kinase kinase kinase 3 [Elysia marginata]
MGNKRARQLALHNLQKRSELKVKCEFGGEKRVLSVPRPVMYPDLVRRLQEMYQMLISVFYTQCNGEIYIPLRSQQDLDAAVQLVDQNEHLTSLRLYLTPALNGGGAGGGGSMNTSGYGGGGVGASEAAGHSSVHPAGAGGYPSSPSVGGQVGGYSLKGSTPPVSYCDIYV